MKTRSSIKAIISATGVVLVLTAGPAMADLSKATVRKIANQEITKRAPALMTTVLHATTADNATHANSADHATGASHAVTADTAGHATTAGHAGTADTAETASVADVAVAANPMAYAAVSRAGVVMGVGIKQADLHSNSDPNLPVYCFSGALPKAIQVTLTYDPFGVPFFGMPIAGIGLPHDEVCPAGTKYSLPFASPPVIGVQRLSL